jgi:hypothetical protein
MMYFYKVLTRDILESPVIGALWGFPKAQVLISMAKAHEHDRT